MITVAWRFYDSKVLRSYDPMKRTTKQEIIYHYRGGVERGIGGSYEWRDGYSETVQGGVLYPWMTRKECRHDASVRGCRAVFYRDGKKESETPPRCP